MKKTRAIHIRGVAVQTHRIRRPLLSATFYPPDDSPHGRGAASYVYVQPGFLGDPDRQCGS